jgi:hypothetical protein
MEATTVAKRRWHLYRVTKDFVYLFKNCAPLDRFFQKVFVIPEQEGTFITPVSDL